MQLILQNAGPQRIWPINVGSRLIVGRGEGATVSITEDSFLSTQHFAIEWNGTTCLLQDLGSRNGTKVNGRSVRKVQLHDGDHISAGEAQFIVRLSQPAADVISLRELLFRSSPVLGLVDGASNGEMFYRLSQSGQKFQSLYEGEQGMQLGAYGPCLVALDAENAFTQYLMQQGWGQAWCTYLSCSQPLELVRHHLRRFLTVRWASGQIMYFRFYDPRILRQFLPTCSPEQARNFFGPVAGYIVEGPKPQTAIHFTHSEGRVSQKEAAVAN